jgi:hypothetical protein
VLDWWAMLLSGCSWPWWRQGCHQVGLEGGDGLAPGRGQDLPQPGAGSGTSHTARWAASSCA